MPAEQPDARPLRPLAVSLGDPAGIGPDITIASWLARRRDTIPPFVVYGDADVLRARARALDVVVPISELARPEEAVVAFTEALPVCRPDASDVRREPGSSTSGMVVASIEAATAAVAQGSALALVTGPIAKKSLQSPSFRYPGHTEFLGVLAARHFPGRAYRPVMMLAAEELKVVPVTVHIALADVFRALTRPLLLDTIRTTAAALRDDFGIDAPRIAVAGLNPHAGEGGLLGTEEARVIAPAIAELRAEGLLVSGPHAADALFHTEARRDYDAAVAMYHDQALIPLKTLAFDRGVNVTLGLPFVRTSPDHGTAFDLAGTGRARPGSFMAALQLAAELGQRRAKPAAQAAPSLP